MYSLKNKIFHCFKRRHCATVLHLCLHSSVVVVDLPTDCILSFLSPAETDVLTPIFSQSIDIVVVNCVVVLKFPIMPSVDSSWRVFDRR